MDDAPSSNYKGFDIYPLVYKSDPTREWYERRPDRSYNVSVVICDEGSDPGGTSARVFPLPSDQWDSLGGAKRAAILGGQTIIDSLRPGESIGGRLRTGCR